MYAQQCSSMYKHACWSWNKWAKKALYRSSEYQTNFKTVALLVAEKFEIDFQDGGCGSRLGILIGIIKATFTFQITLILPTRFPVKCPFALGEVQKRVTRWHLGLLIEMILTVFFIYKLCRYFLSSFISFGILVQEKTLKTHFQDKCQLGFRIGLILTGFDLRVTQIFPAKFGVSWPFGSGEG